MTFLSITWDVDPIIFSIGSFGIRYYSLFFVVAFCVSYILFKRFYKDENLPIEQLDKLTFYYVIPATIIGARLGHCLFYEPAYYLAHPLEIILPFSDGKFTGYQGLASHGAAFGILLALFLYARKYKISLMWLLDRIGIAVAVSGFFVRMGNLMNSEIFGRPTGLPWGFRFIRSAEYRAQVPNMDIGCHPTQLYEGLSYLFIFFLLFFLYSKMRKKLKPGTLFGLFLILLFSARFLIEFVKLPQEAFEQNMTLVMGQWLSLPFIILGAVVLYLSVKGKLPKFALVHAPLRPKNKQNTKGKK